MARRCAAVLAVVGTTLALLLGGLAGLGPAYAAQPAAGATAAPSTSVRAATPAVDRRCRTGRVMCIDKSQRTLRWVVGGKVRMTMAARFGARSSPTREGSFKVFKKSRHHVSSIYHSPMPFAMFFSGGQAVHYSSDFAARGYAGASHGCVNIRDRGKLARLFGQVRLGDRVVVTR